MAKTPEMNFIVENTKIIVSLPLTSQGKFRCKNRDDIQSFGNGFAPKSTIITNESYLEWQIGYDTIIGKDEKETKLNSDEFIFIGANKKSKHPYELSEITYFMCKKNIITRKEILDIYNRIASIKTFLQDKYSIEVKKEDSVILNDIKFLSSSTKLPTFITRPHGSNLLIEIMIQKQQYATGVQPMLYLIVPVNAFDNKEKIINHTSAETPNGIITFDASLKATVFDLLICFGMCSSAHNHDVLEIINVIMKNAF